MRIYNFQQGSYEWDKIRCGTFTASEIHKLMGAKGLGETGITYIREKVAETLTGQSNDFFENAAMKHGKDLEPTAKEYYEIAFSEKINNVGFIMPDNSEDYGVSPDGILEGKNKGIEIKCPYNPVNHVKHLLIRSSQGLKEACKEYYWQVMMCLLVTGFESWDFVSFDLRFDGNNRMFAIEIQRNESDIKLLNDRITQAISEKQRMIELINL
jgi:putative phage-type endonuclease